MDYVAPTFQIEGVFCV